MKLKRTASIILCVSIILGSKGVFTMASQLDKVIGYTIYKSQMDKNTLRLGLVSEDKMETNYENGDIELIDESEDVVNSEDSELAQEEAIEEISEINVEHETEIDCEIESETNILENESEIEVDFDDDKIKEEDEEEIVETEETEETEHIEETGETEKKESIDETEKIKETEETKEKQEVDNEQETTTYDEIINIDISPDRTISTPTDAISEIASITEIIENDKESNLRELQDYSWEKYKGSSNFYEKSNYHNKYQKQLFENHRIREAWEYIYDKGLNGKSNGNERVAVAVYDEGFLEELKNKTNFNKENISFSKCKKDNHGTNVAYIIGDNFKDFNANDEIASVSVSGVASGYLNDLIKIYPQKMDGNKKYLHEDFINQSIQNKVKVINISMEAFEDLAINSVEDLDDMPCIVWSAGNEAINLDYNEFNNYDKDTKKKLVKFLDNNIYVGALQNVDKNSKFKELDDTKSLKSYSYYTNRGDLVDIYACSNNLTSLFELNKKDGDTDDIKGRRFNGTSSAAPVVTGIVALMYKVNPNLTPFQVKNIIYKTARMEKENGTNDEIRIIDACSAVKEAYELRNVDLYKIKLTNEKKNAVFFKQTKFVMNDIENEAKRELKDGDYKQNYIMLPRPYFYDCSIDNAHGYEWEIKEIDGQDVSKITDERKDFYEVEDSLFTVNINKVLGNIQKYKEYSSKEHKIKLVYKNINDNKICIEYDCNIDGIEIIVYPNEHILKQDFRKDRDGFFALGASALINPYKMVSAFTLRDKNRDVINSDTFAKTEYNYDRVRIGYDIGSKLNDFLANVLRVSEERIEILPHIYGIKNPTWSDEKYIFYGIDKKLIKELDDNDIGNYKVGFSECYNNQVLYPTGALDRRNIAYTEYDWLNFKKKSWYYAIQYGIYYGRSLTDEVEIAGMTKDWENIPKANQKIVIPTKNILYTRWKKSSAFLGYNELVIIPNKDDVEYIEILEKEMDKETPSTIEITKTYDDNKNTIYNIAELKFRIKEYTDKIMQDNRSVIIPTILEFGNSANIMYDKNKGYTTTSTNNEILDIKRLNNSRVNCNDNLIDYNVNFRQEDLKDIYEKIKDKNHKLYLCLQRVDKRVFNDQHCDSMNTHSVNDKNTYYNTTSTKLIEITIRDNEEELKQKNKTAIKVIDGKNKFGMVKENDDIKSGSCVLTILKKLLCCCETKERYKKNGMNLDEIIVSKEMEVAVLGEILDEMGLKYENERGILIGGKVTCEHNITKIVDLTEPIALGANYEITLIRYNINNTAINKLCNLWTDRNTIKTKLAMQSLGILKAYVVDREQYGYQKQIDAYLRALIKNLNNTSSTDNSYIKIYLRNLYEENIGKDTSGIDNQNSDTNNDYSEEYIIETQKIEDVELRRFLEEENSKPNIEYYEDVDENGNKVLKVKSIKESDKEKMKKLWEEIGFDIEKVSKGEENFEKILNNFLYEIFLDNELTFEDFAPYIKLDLNKMIPTSSEIVTENFEKFVDKYGNEINTIYMDEDVDLVISEAKSIEKDKFYDVNISRGNGGYIYKYKAKQKGKYSFVTFDNKEVDPRIEIYRANGKKIDDSSYIEDRDGLYNGNAIINREMEKDEEIYIRCSFEDSKVGSYKIAVMNSNEMKPIIGNSNDIIKITDGKYYLYNDLKSRLEIDTNREVEIDLNGHILRGDDGKSVIEILNGNLTISNGTIVSNNSYAICGNKNTKINIESGNYYTSGNYESIYGGVININGGRFKNPPKVYTAKDNYEMIKEKNKIGEYELDYRVAPKEYIADIKVGNTNHQYEGYTKINSNLNNNTKKGEIIYLWYKRTADINQAIKDIKLTYNEQGCSGYNISGWTKVEYDVNSKTGGDNIYIWYTKSGTSGIKNIRIDSLNRAQEDKSDMFTAKGNRNYKYTYTEVTYEKRTKSVKVAKTTYKLVRKVVWKKVKSFFGLFKALFTWKWKEYITYVIEPVVKYVWETRVETVPITRTYTTTKRDTKYYGDLNKNAGGDYIYLRYSY